MKSFTFGEVLKRKHKLSRDLDQLRFVIHLLTIPPEATLVCSRPREHCLAVTFLLISWTREAPEGIVQYLDYPARHV